ncbi:hypothetical protein NQ315_002138, partial [Exocentrus adspersus]
LKEDSCYDVAVIGGGIIGTAVAREISLRSKKYKDNINREGNRFGKTTERYTQVLSSAGVYYRPDSLKGKFSRRGTDLLVKYCDANKIPYKTCGKLVVATDASTLKNLRILRDRGVANKVEGLEMLWTKQRIREIEPKCNGIQALWCPKTSNVDFGIVTERFGKDFQGNGGRILLNEEVNLIAESETADHPVLIKTKRGSIVNTKYLVACGGIHSDVLSSYLEDDPKTKSVVMSLKVDYQLLKKHSIQTNIYGVPDLGMPFLGVHLTPRLDGKLLLGPGAIPAFQKEGYGNDGISFGYVKNTLSSAGFQNMTRRYLVQCLNQVKKSLWPSFQAEELQSLAEINVEDIQPGPQAVQAQLINSDGSFVDDFTFEFLQGDGIRKRVINCKFLPSPAATCSLAIAEFVVEQLLQGCEDKSI